MRIAQGCIAALIISIVAVFVAGSAQAKPKGGKVTCQSLYEQCVRVCNAYAADKAKCKNACLDDKHDCTRGPIPSQKGGTNAPSDARPSQKSR